MTCEPVLVTSKVRVPAGASAAETSQSSSVDSTVSARGSPPSAAPPLALSAFSVQAARNGRGDQQGGHDEGLAHGH